MKELKELYNTYYPQLYAYCLTLTRSKPDAEDLTAETFYRAITHIVFFDFRCYAVAPKPFTAPLRISVNSAATAN